MDVSDGQKSCLKRVYIVQTFWAQWRTTTSVTAIRGTVPPNRGCARPAISLETRGAYALTLHARTRPRAVHHCARETSSQLRIRPVDALRGDVKRLIYERLDLVQGLARACGCAKSRTWGGEYVDWKVLVFVRGAAPLLGGPPFAMYMTMGAAVEPSHPKKVGCRVRFCCSNVSIVGGMAGNA